MRKVKNWVLAALALVVLGGITAVITLAANGWSFKKFSEENYTTKTYEVNEDFVNISIDAITTDVVFLPSTDGKCKVVAYQEENTEYAVSVADGTLNVQLVAEKKWYQEAFNFEEEKLTVYLPKTAYGTLTIDITTGDIEAKDILCERLTIDSTTGDVELKNVTCKTLFTDGTTGDVELENVVATESMYIERTTGDVEFVRCDGAEITVKVTTGDVSGTLLTEKIFLADTSTGDKEIPQSTTGGKCTITTTTGDISIKIVQ
jgi:DUF4097 and DUF4098 domain-containing protein YvlB